jgi:hypothetical protein
MIKPHYLNDDAQQLDVQKYDEVNINFDWLLIYMWPHPMVIINLTESI